MSDGTRSIVTLPEGETLAPGDEIVSGLEITIPFGPAAGNQAGNQGGNLFRPKMPERNQRGTGGVEAKPGQNVKQRNRPPTLIQPRTSRD